MIRIKHPAIPAFLQTPGAEAQGAAWFAQNRMAIRGNLGKAYGNKCAYCESPAPEAEVDHFIPGLRTWDNLRLCCRTCNTSKGGVFPVDQETGDVVIIDPTVGDPEDQFEYEEGGQIIGLTPAAKRTIDRLRLNRAELVNRRKAAIEEFDRLIERDLPAAADAIELYFTGAHVPWAGTLRFRQKSKGNVRSVAPVDSLGIRRLRLENVGPFRRLDLEVNGRRTVILGQNGVGKSHILRALALVLVGTDGRRVEVADAMMKRGETLAEIDVELTDGVTYQSQMESEGDLSTFELRVGAPTPVQQQKILALGFPTVRGHQPATPRGPSGAGTRNPDVEDLFPLLVASQVDPLSALLQWIVNRDTQSKLADSEHARYRAQEGIKGLFDCLGRVVPDFKIAFSRVESENWTVLVHTPDGELPLNQLSQGLSSSIAWVGIVYCRLMDCFPKSPNPAHESAWVLIDEIDVHLHPHWQQSLLTAVAREFPNLQLIATTHSPLVAGSLDPGELVLLRRGPDDDIECIVVTEDFRGLRADQILTSEVFALEGTRSLQSRQAQDNYLRLLDDPAASPEDLARAEAEMVRLSSFPAEHLRDRREQEAKREEDLSLLHKELEGLDPDALAELQRLLAEPA